MFYPKNIEKMDEKTREKHIYRITWIGGLINVLLLLAKFVAAVAGHSAAMMADAIHSMSDFVTDVIVVVFVKMGGKPADENHDYGHGKYETLATAIIGIMLLGVGVMIAYDGIVKIVSVFRGNTLPSPGMIALYAAIASIVLKEFVFRITMRCAREVNSETVKANAWHHRSDAFSSIGTALGIGGAIFLGDKWTLLDPLSAIIVSGFIIYVGMKITYQAVGELLERSLPAGIEAEIERISMSEPGVSEMHHLRTRTIGGYYAIEMHLRMEGDTSLYEAHRKASNIENRLRKQFGSRTIVNIHCEPLKINGTYQPPKV